MMLNLSGAIKRFITPKSIKNVCGGKSEFQRYLWHMSKSNEILNNQQIFGSKFNSRNPSLIFKCDFINKYVHTKSERELVEFLTEEILAERKAQKITSVPSSVDGFNVKLIGAEVELSKQTEKEKIVINFNVNHTVDTEDEPDLDSTEGKAEVGEMRSKPRFEVDIIKGNTTLSFTCSFLEDTPQEGEYNDIFGIDEMTIYQGEWNDKVYAVAGDVLDGYLYDLLMNLLEEKGISNEFVEKLSDLATAYEHASYIGMLESLSKFTTGSLETKMIKENHA